MNPYQYAADNPVKFIDVNGDYIYIYDINGTYRYDNGKAYTQDRDGNWTQEYVAEAGSYIANILAALDEMIGDDANSAGSQLLNFFANSDINVNVINNNSQGATKDKNLTSGDYIYTSFNQNESIPTTSGNISNLFYVTLAHELAHGLANNLFDKAELTKAWVKASSINGLPQDITQSEVYACTFENLIRSEKGLPLRTHYSPGAEGSVVEQSRLIKKTKDKNAFHQAYEPTSGATTILNNILKTRKK